MIALSLGIRVSAVWAVCGDGRLEPKLFDEAGEECDGPFCVGGTNDGKPCTVGREGDCPCGTCRSDLCDSRCKILHCGNGAVDFGEECDGPTCYGGVNDGKTCRPPRAGCPDNSVADCPGGECRSCDSQCGCGNGTVNHKEQCDDGRMNSDEPDARCRTDCLPRRCQDGITDPGHSEVCDPGNRPGEKLTGGVVTAQQSKTCDRDCTVPACLDGVPNGPAGEACDSGACNSDAPASACSTSCTKPALCGNGVLDPGETCDDGSNDGNGCAVGCGQPVCGNGIIAPNETCDGGADSNATNPAADCPSRCGQYAYSDGALTPACACRPAGCERTASGACCGDGAVNLPGEECDDGGPSVTCNFDCSIQHCGDRKVNAAAGEECDEDPALGRCTAACRLVPCDGQNECLLLPIADTRIESGLGESFDHGIQSEIEVNGEPRAVAYLKFDLTGLRPAVAHATLEMVCTRGPAICPLDPGTIYTVPDSTWIEGNRDGKDGVDTEKDSSHVPPDRYSSKHGPGLKWIDVDADGDGSIGVNERSRYAPDVLQPIAHLDHCVPGIVTRADVTEAFQRGPGVYTIAIGTDDRPGSVRYASREFPIPAWRPVLRVAFEYQPECGNGVVDAGEECDDGNTKEDTDGADPFTDCCSNACGLTCCGNGRTDPGETCDDGNRENGDLCSATCQREVTEPANCCDVRLAPGCDVEPLCEDCVCGLDDFCCSGRWDDQCVLIAETNCAGACLCGGCRAEPGEKCRINPMADTYVEGPTVLAIDPSVDPNDDCTTGGEATWDHGGRDRFDIDGDPRGIGYMKFDLSALEAKGLIVRSATLHLFSVNNPSRNGVDVHPLNDSSWEEGTCEGQEENYLCSCDPTGKARTKCELLSDLPPVCSADNVLRFVALDSDGDGFTNGDGFRPAEQDSSRFLPDFTQSPVGTLPSAKLGESPIDVTGAFRPEFKWGTGLYSLVLDQHPPPAGMIPGIEYDDGSTFTSREYFDPAKHPVLEVVVGCSKDEQCPRSTISCKRAVCREGACGFEDVERCKPCTTSGECQDDDPCTTDRCGEVEEGCLPHASVTGFASASCALGEYAPAACGQFKSFVTKRGGRKERACKLLKTACERALGQKALLRTVRKVRAAVASERRAINQYSILLGLHRPGRQEAYQNCATALRTRVGIAERQLDHVIDGLKTGTSTLCEGSLACK